MGSPRSIGSSFSINIASLRDFPDSPLERAHDLSITRDPGALPLAITFHVFSVKPQRVWRSEIRNSQFGSGFLPTAYRSLLTFLVFSSIHFRHNSIYIGRQGATFPVFQCRDGMHSRHSRRCGNKASRSWARRGRSFLTHRGRRLLAGGRGVLCRRLNCPCDQFLVSTALTLPKRKNSVRIGALIYGSRRRNDLATATWARTAARGAPLDIDYT